MLQLKLRPSSDGELIALPFPFSSERKIWPSNVVVVQGGQ